MNGEERSAESRESAVRTGVSRLFRMLLLVAMACLAGAVRAAELNPLPADGDALRNAPVVVPFDIEKLKANWRKRIEAVRAAGMLPIIDIESSFNSNRVDIRALAEAMDDNGVALIAYSSDARRGRWSDAAAQVVHVDPWRFIPTTNGGDNRRWAQEPADYVAENLKRALADRYPLLGEFEFRHYPSPRQYRRGEMDRDVTIPIDGPAGQELFSFSERTGIAFQIHYEIEDALLPVLEAMLRRYPKAKVIWCHLGQVRYSSRSTIYGPAYVRKLIETHPNLYFDLAFGGPNSVYPGSREHHARVWDQERGGVGKEWVELISRQPWRFLAALDMGGDRMDQLPPYTRRLRSFIDHLPAAAREIVAYRAAWKLLFGEALP